jgi:hypothetical protein
VLSQQKAKCPSRRGSALDFELGHHSTHHQCSRRSKWSSGEQPPPLPLQQLSVFRDVYHQGFLERSQKQRRLLLHTPRRRPLHRRRTMRAIMTPTLTSSLYVGRAIRSKQESRSKHRYQKSRNRLSRNKRTTHPHVTRRRTVVNFHRKA